MPVLQTTTEQICASPQSGGMVWIHAPAADAQLKEAVTRTRRTAVAVGLVGGLLLGALIGRALPRPK